MPERRTASGRTQSVTNSRLAGSYRHRRSIQMEYAAACKGREPDVDRSALSWLLGRSSSNFVWLQCAFNRYIRIAHTRHMHPITPGILCLVEELIRFLKGPFKLKSLGDR